MNFIPALTAAIFRGLTLLGMKFAITKKEENERILVTFCFSLLRVKEKRALTHIVLSYQFSYEQEMYIYLHAKGFILSWWDSFVAGHKSHTGQKICFTPKYREKCIYFVLKDHTLYCEHLTHIKVYIFWKLAVLTLKEPGFLDPSHSRGGGADSAP